ncbi:MAG: 16S rRNA (guanine(527)-N(7))-methyltransferase RsmG, partial [Bacillota bacterium]|nr:16S rRNA (guanine(527)-N(7))-methyltransferase RsmG [Bacillota bacterium]
MSFVNDLSEVAKEYGLELTSDQISAFNKYYELLVEWNEKINLTAITEPREVAIKHIVDSLSCYQKELFTGQVSLIDVGTGAGFPGLPLKIFCPELKLILLDSLNKRVKFLQLVVDELGLKDVEVIHARSEEAARN